MFSTFLVGLLLRLLKALGHQEISDVNHEPHNHADKECPICGDHVKVPCMIIEPRRNYINGKEHTCCTRKRLCLRCTRTYLGLNPEIPVPRGIKNCPFCNYPSGIESISNSYRVDLCIFNTFNPAKGKKLSCDCGEEFSTQEDLYKHIQTSCEESYVNCDTCSTSYKRSEGCKKCIIVNKCVFCFRGMTSLGLDWHDFETCGEDMVKKETEMFRELLKQLYPGWTRNPDIKKKAKEFQNDLEIEYQNNLQNPRIPIDAPRYYERVIVKHFGEDAWNQTKHIFEH